MPRNLQLCATLRGFGEKVPPRNHTRSRRCASAFYSGILGDIEKHDYDVFSRHTSLSLWGKISRIPNLWLKVRSL